MISISCFLSEVQEFKEWVYSNIVSMHLHLSRKDEPKAVLVSTDPSQESTEHVKYDTANPLYMRDIYSYKHNNWLLDYPLPVASFLESVVSSQGFLIGQCCKMCVYTKGVRPVAQTLSTNKDIGDTTTKMLDPQSPLPTAVCLSPLTALLVFLITSAPAPPPLDAGLRGLFTHLILSSLHCAGYTILRLS